MNKKVIVIGSGIAGLSAAARLCKRGFNVEVFEANSSPGGKLSEKLIEGYRFDLGPSLFTLPNLFDDLFKECNKNPKDYLEYQKIDPISNYFFEDGTIINAKSDIALFASEWEEKLGLKKEIILSYLQQSKRKYDLTHSIFLEKSLHKIKSYLNFKTLKLLVNIGSLGLNKTIDKYNQSKLKHPKAIQYFNRFATYNGSSPYLAPSTLTIIPHLEHHLGAFFPKGGMYSITTSLYNLCNDLGVTFHFNSKVDEILIEKNKTKGILCKNEKYYSDSVISNMDIFQTYNKLIPAAKKPVKILKQEKSSSAIIFYWGITKEFPELGLHNILFSENYELEFETIFKNKYVYIDPTIYINISSKYKKSDAPKGCENWFVMINTPSNQNQDWDLIVKDARLNIINKINRILKTNVESFIQVEEVLTPRLIEERTSSWGGSLYGNSSNNKFAAFLRHKNFSSEIDNLFFCGGSVHPGGGIPLAMLSGKIASELIK